MLQRTEACLLLLLLLLLLNAPEQCGEISIRVYIGTIGLYWGYIGRMENKMEATI